MSSGTAKAWRLGYFDREALIICLRCLPHIKYTHLAEAFGVNHSTVRFYARKVGLHLRKERVTPDQAVLCALYVAEGDSLREVGRKMGRDHQTVKRAVLRLEASKRPGGRSGPRLIVKS